MKFEIGEIALLNCPGFYWHNTEVTVIGIERIEHIDRVGYVIDVPGYPSRHNDKCWFVPANFLKKRPYKDQHTPYEKGWGELQEELKTVTV